MSTSVRKKKSFFSKKSQVGEAILWISRILLVILTVIFVKDILYAGTVYSFSENDAYLKRIFFSKAGILKTYDFSEFSSFNVLDTSEMNLIPDKLDKLFYYKRDIGVKIEINCPNFKDRIYYLNEPIYETRKLFKNQYFVNNVTLYVDCLYEDSYGNHYFEKGNITAGIVTSFDQGRVQN